MHAAMVIRSDGLMLRMLYFQSATPDSNLTGSSKVWSFIVVLRSVKLVVGTLGGMIGKSELPPPTGAAALRQMNLTNRFLTHW